MNGNTDGKTQPQSTFTQILVKLSMHLVSKPLEWRIQDDIGQTEVEALGNNNAGTHLTHKYQAGECNKLAVTLSIYQIT